MFGNDASFRWLAIFGSITTQRGKKEYISPEDSR